MRDWAERCLVQEQHGDLELLEDNQQPVFLGHDSESCTPSSHKAPEALGCPGDCVSDFPSLSLFLNCA